MPYTPTTWVEGVTKLGPTNMNHLETGVSNVTTTADAAIAKPSSPATNDGLVWNGSTWVNAKLVNANIDPAAAIVYSKLSLAGGIVNNDINSGAAIALSKLAWSGNAPFAPYRKTTAKAVNTTVSATDLLNAEITIAAGTMGTTGCLRLRVWGDWLQNSGGAAAPPRFQLVIGGTTFFDTSTGGGTSCTASATRYHWNMEFHVLNAAANSQLCEVSGTLGNDSASAWGTTFTTGNGLYDCYSASTQGLAYINGVNSGLAVDTTAAKALVLNVINGSANAAYETKLFGALVEIV